MHNGTTTIDAYGQNLDKLKVGDRVGVVRRDSGVIHFYVNGEDQGPAATNVPERIYGVIDLYGQAAQVIEISPENLDIYILLISSIIVITDNLNRPRIFQVCDERGKIDQVLKS